MAPDVFSQPQRQRAQGSQQNQLRQAIAGKPFFLFPKLLKSSLYCDWLKHATAEIQRAMVVVKLTKTNLDTVLRQSHISIKRVYFRACLHGGGGPQIGEVTCGGSPHLSCKRDHIKMRDYMDRRVTPPKRVTSPNWGLPRPCKQRPISRKFR